MMIKASGRSALILATGLFVCLAGLSSATTATKAATGSKSESATGTSATSNKSVRQSSRNGKKYAHRRSSKVALKSYSTRKATDADVADAASSGSIAIPLSVANANAELASDAPADSTRAMTARANALLLAAADNTADAPAAAGGQVVSPDQLNDVDRALQESKPSGQTVAMAAGSTAKAAAPVLASSNESSAWDQTSLIGKIFIGFGALLTLASAARMFMA